MFDSFLTSILQIIIVVDILAVVAYFVLGGFKRKGSAKIASPATPKFRFNKKARPATLASNLPDAFGDLKRVLYSFERGLA